MFLVQKRLRASPDKKSSIGKQKEQQGCSSCSGLHDFHPALEH